MSRVTEVCPSCNQMIEPVLASAAVIDWDADDEQVEAMGKEYEDLICNWIQIDTGIVLNCRFCPECKEMIGNFWIEEGIERMAKGGICDG